MAIAKLKKAGIWLSILAVLLICGACTSGVKTFNGRPWEYYIYGGCSLSPDNSLIAFDFYGLRYKGIFLMNRFGRLLNWLCEDNDEWSSGDPVFSPDGKHIAFFRGKHDGPWHIYMMNSDGTNIRRVTSGTQVDWRPVFSKDGQRIYFIRHKGLAGSEGVIFYSGDIFCVDVNTGIEKRLTHLAMDNVKNLSVLPDEKSCIITTTSFNELGTTCWRLDLTGSDKKQPVLPDLSRFSDDPLSEEEVSGKVLYKYLDIINPRVSGDGKVLAFTWVNPKRVVHGYDKRQLYVAEMDTLRAHKTTDLEYEAFVEAISWNGEIILVENDYGSRDFGDPYIPKSPLWVVYAGESVGERNLSLDFRGLEGKQALIRNQEYDLNGLVE